MAPQMVKPEKVFPQEYREHEDVVQESSYQCPNGQGGEKRKASHLDCQEGEDPGPHLGNPAGVVVDLGVTITPYRPGDLGDEGDSSRHEGGGEQAEHDHGDYYRGEEKQPFFMGIEQEGDPGQGQSQKGKAEPMDPAGFEKIPEYGGQSNRYQKPPSDPLLLKEEGQMDQ